MAGRSGGLERDGGFTPIFATELRETHCIHQNSQKSQPSMSGVDRSTTSPSSHLPKPMAGTTMGGISQEVRALIYACRLS